MQLVQLILPSLATIALGSALLAPHRAEAPKLPRTSRARRPSRATVPKENAESNSTSADVVSSDRSAGEEPSHGRGREVAREPKHGEIVANATSAEMAPHSPQTEMAPGTPGADVAQLERLELGPIVASADGWSSVSASGESERVVPLTRLRLRPRATTVGWPALLDATRPNCGAEERLLLLRTIDGVSDTELRERALLRALEEEDGELRLIALRALARMSTPAAGDALAEVLVRGADDERAVAVDGLRALGRRAELVAAFDDRVEAVAAKAALAYVGTRRRDDYCEVLDAHVEPPRRDAILALLAGSLE
jgi:hypothetical protein